MKMRTVLLALALATAGGSGQIGAAETAAGGFGAAPLGLPNRDPAPDDPWLTEPVGRLSGAFDKAVAQRYSDARAVSAIADLKREGIACTVNTNKTQTGGDVASQGFACSRIATAQACTLTWTVRLQTFRGEMRQTRAKFARSCARG